MGEAIVVLMAIMFVFGLGMVVKKSFGALKQMNHPLKLLDVVALTDNLPESALHRGQVGTIVEILDRNVYEVEFSDDDGQAYAMHALSGDQLAMLHYDLPKAA